jgi:predicted permease
MNDLRFAIRQLLKNRGFTAVVVLTLALGIGSATAVFSIVNAILLRSLPVPNPHELRVLQWTGIDARPRSISGQVSTSGNRSVAECVSPSMFQDLRERAAGMADVFAFAPLDDAVVRTRTEAFATDAMVVSDNFFTALGVQPVVGRVFTPNENSADAALGVVITFDQWGKHFAHDPKAVGRSLTLNGHNLTISGVLPRGFSGVRPGTRHGFYVRMAPNSPFLQRAVSVEDHWWVRLMARMKPAVGDARLKSALDALFATQVAEVMRQPEILVQPGAGGQGFDRVAYGKPLLLLLAVVGLVLLVACANIAGLLLARGAARQHEWAVRAAVGAGRWRLIRESMVESALLSVIGGGLGVVLGIQGRTVISWLLSQPSESLSYDFSLDLVVMGFSLAITFAIALLSGLPPALRAGGADPLASLKSRTALGTPRLRAGRVLVVAQIALSLVLLSGAGLFVRTLLNLRGISAGFDTERLLVFQLNAGFAGYQDDEMTAFYDRVQTSLAAIPGAKGAALTFVPLLDNKGSSGGFSFRSRPMEPSENPQTHRLVVGETFFDTMGIPLLHGRGLSSAHSGEASKVIVINETFARSYFPDHDPVGHSINTWRSDWEIIGVCADTKYQNIRDPVPPTIYIPFRQFPLRNGAHFVVRTALPPMALANAVRKAVAEIDPGVPVANLTTQQRLIDGTMGQERLVATLCTALAIFAVILSCIGLYGLLAFNVARRTAEIGVRMALGAQRWDVGRGIACEALILAGLGLGVGLPVTWAVGRFIQSQLYGVQRTDPATLIVVISISIAVALVSACLPARRAAKVDPMVALRSE